MISRVFLLFLITSTTASIVILVLLLLLKTFRRRYEAKWEYMIWLVLVVRLLIPFGLTVPGLTAALPMPNSVHVTEKIDEQALLINEEEPIYEFHGSNSEYEIKENSSTTIEDNSISSVALLEIISLIWLLGCLTFLILNICVHIHYRLRITRAGRPSRASGVKITIGEMITSVGIKRPMRVLISPEAASPMLLGFFRPVLVLPHEDYSESELRLIIRHELTHCRRHDVFLKSVIMLVNAIHWFNPLIYVMSHEIDNCIELCCDSYVVKKGSGTLRKEYGKAILKSIEENSNSIPMSTAFGGSTAEMKERIKNIFDSGIKKSGVLPFVLSLILIVLSSMMISCVKTDASDDSIYGTQTAAEIQTFEQSILPIENEICPLIPVDTIENSVWAQHDEYLDLHEALYCINYARSTEYSTDIPAGDLSEYFYDYEGFEQTECSFFGSGVPCVEWQNNRAWLYPFHSDGSDPFSASEVRDTWAIFVSNPNSEANSLETIYVDAQTGDMYIPTARGGYRPSPYFDRSEYSKALISE